MKNSRHNLVLLLILVSFFVFRLVELVPVGETWDEIAKIRNGQLHIRSIVMGDFSYDTWAVHKEHPPLGKIFLALPTYLTSRYDVILFDDYVYHKEKAYILSRIVSLLFATFTLLVVFCIAKKLFDKKIALFSVIGLAFLPHFVAHSFIATLESPQTFFITLLIFALVKVSDLIKHKKLQIIIGVLLALSMLIKLSSIFFIPMPFVFLLRDFFRTKDFKKFIFATLLVYFIAGLIFYLFWPWLWANPVLRLQETFSHFDVVRKEYFMGENINVPVYYYLYYYLISTPIVYLVFFGLGLFSKNSFKKLILVLWVFLPFIASFSSFKQNGVRYLHASFPAFVILSAIGLSNALSLVKNKVYSVVVAFVVLIIIIFTSTTSSPYYLDYYNFLVGGSIGVYENKLAQIGWWGEGTKEAWQYINENLPQNARLCMQITPTFVPPITRKDIRVNFTSGGDVCDKDYVVVNTLNKWQHGYEIVDSKYELVHEVTAGGASLVQLYKKR